MKTPDESKARLDKHFDQLQNTFDIVKKKELVSLILNELDDVVSGISFDTKNDLKGKLEILLKEMWVDLQIWDVKSIGSIYNVDRENYTFQLYYTKALINSADPDVCLDFLKSGSPIHNSQDILENLYEISSVGKNWEYTALMISSNKVFDMQIMSNYLNFHSSVIDGQIIKNYKEKGANKELTRFLKLLWTRFPNDTEITVEYLEALEAGLDIPAMANILRAMNLNIPMDETQSIRLSKLLLSINEAEKSISILNQVISKSSGNEMAIEYLTNALYRTGEFERIISLLQNHRNLILRSPEITEEFMRACFEIGNYRSAIDILKEFKPGFHFTPQTRVTLAQLLLLSGDVNTARSYYNTIPEDYSSSKEVKKLRLQFSKLDGVDSEYLNSAIGYMLENPEDRKYFNSMVLDLWKMGKKKMICRLFEELTNSFTGKDELKYAVMSLISEQMPEGVIQSIEKLGIESTDEDIIMELLSKYRSANMWTWPVSLDPESFPVAHSIMNYMHNFFQYNFEVLKANRILPALDKIGITTAIELFVSLHEKENSELETYFNKLRTIFKTESDVMVLNYPITNALLRMGRNDEARDLMDKVERMDDPYYEYFFLITHAPGISSSKEKKIENLKTLTGSSLIRCKLLELRANDISGSETMTEVENLVRIGGGISIPWKVLYDAMKGKKSADLQNFQDILEYSGVKTIEALLVEVEFLKSQDKIDGALKLMGEINRLPRNKLEDTVDYIRLIIKSGNASLLESVAPQLERLSLPPEIYEIVGNFYLQSGEPVLAEHYFDKIRKGKNMGGAREGYIKALIDQGKYDRALEEFQTPGVPDYLRLSLYSKAGLVKELSAMLKTLVSVDEHMEVILEDVVDRYWENKVIRSNLVSMARKTLNQKLVLDVSARLHSDGKLEESLELLKGTFRDHNGDYSVASALTDKLAGMGKFEDMVSTGTTFFKSSAEVESKKLILSKILKFLFDSGTLSEISRLYDSYKNLLSADSVETVTLSFISQQKFEEAANLLSATHLSILDQEKFNNLSKVLKRSENISDIITIAEKLMKACVKYDKFLDKREAAMYTKINLSKIDEVYEYLRKPGDYHGMDEDFLEKTSTKILKTIYKKTGKNSIEELGLHDYFLGLGMKDIQLAQIMKTYIEDTYFRRDDRKVRFGKQYEKLVRQAAGISSVNPFIYCITLNIGIDEAMSLRRALQSMDGEF